MKVIYFNQWFSSITNVIEDIKLKHSIRIVASSKTPEHVYRYTVDRFFVEDWEEIKGDTEVSMKNYVNWVLALCEREHVNLFFVKKYATYIMKAAKRFEAIGVKLISEDYDTLKSMESKSSVYSELMVSDELKKLIPEYHVFDKNEEAAKYIENHRGKNNICLKFDKDEGGASFRAIKDKKQELKDLYTYDVNILTSDEARELVIEAGEGIKRILFMEILESPEISIDCYKSRKGFISLARMKIAGRKQRIFYNEKLSAICESIGNKLNLKFPYNVQFRVIAGGNAENIEDLRLLEINPRMSGGLYYEVACGKNIAETCMMDNFDSTDYYIEDFSHFKDVYVTHVEKAVLIK